MNMNEEDYKRFKKLLEYFVASLELKAKGLKYDESPQTAARCSFSARRTRCGEHDHSKATNGVDTQGGGYTGGRQPLHRATTR